jgi:glucose-6-phosphate isomerase
VLQKLLDMADAANLKGKIDAMFSGEHINSTEDRAVLHVATRARREQVSKYRDSRSCTSHVCFPCSWGVRGERIVNPCICHSYVGTVGRGGRIGAKCQSRRVANEAEGSGFCQS